MGVDGSDTGRDEAWIPLEFIMSVLPCWGASLGGGRAATLMLELWRMYILECPLGLLSEQGTVKFLEERILKRQ